MKAAPFDHVAPATVAEAVSLLGTPGAQVLAGGQSLVPLLALRRARPTLLVDVNELGIDEVEPDLAHGSAWLRLGAAVRHTDVERHAIVLRVAPLLAEATAWIASAAVRHRGTLGGSLAYADPAAELPAAVLALGGEVVLQGPAGTRDVAAASLASGPFATVIEPDELMVAVRVPLAGRGHGAAFCEWTPRHNDRATAGVALAVDLDAAGRCRTVRAAACGVGLSGPLALSEPLTAVAADEATVTDGLLRTAASVTTSAVASTAGGALPGGPGGAAGADEAELVGLLAARALRMAFERARRGREEAA